MAKFKTAFQRLHEFFGTHQAIATAFKIEPQAITYWAREGIPINRAIEVEEKTNGTITAYDVLRG